MIPDKQVGLARALSKMGYCSRSQASILIRAGRVALNGRVVQDPERPARTSDLIEVYGVPLHKLPATYLVMNKPRGIVTTASDEKDRKTVYDLLTAELPWVAPVGRLDKASEGLLLLTNDSEWAAKVTDPFTHLDKKYHVQIDRMADDRLLKTITKSHLDRDRLEPVDEDTFRDSPIRASGAKAARRLRHGGKNSWIEVTLDEGKNRQIRRMLEALGIRVLRLVRVSIGPLELGTLKKGSVRQLTIDEKNAMDIALE